MVPIVHVFTKDDELRTSDGLRSIQFLQEGVRWWAAGTTF